MTERQVINRIQKLKELESQAAELNAKIDALKAEIQAEMNDQEELAVSGYVVRWPHVVSNRLDSARIKKELPDIYSRYVKPSFSRRFTITAI